MQKSIGELSRRQDDMERELNGTAEDITDIRGKISDIGSNISEIKTNNKIISGDIKSMNAMEQARRVRGEQQDFKIKFTLVGIILSLVVFIFLRE